MSTISSTVATVPDVSVAAGVSAVSASSATSGTSAAPASSSGARRIPAPRVLPEALPFWEAAKAGRLLLKRCEDCGQVHYYPRDICPHCLSARTGWIEAGGRGAIYSYSTMGRGEARYTLAYVTLDEGVTLMTNLVDCDPAALEIGQRVSVVFKPVDGGGYPVPMFTPVLPPSSSPSPSAPSPSSSPPSPPSPPFASA